MATMSAPTLQQPIEESDFPREGSLQDQLSFIIRYAAQAPSFFDTQPWEFGINEEALEVSIYADQSRWIKAADPDKRQLYASIGSALENLLVALDAFELGHRLIVYFPEPGDERWVARVTVATARQSIVPRPRELLSAIDSSGVIPYGFRSNQPSASDVAASIAFMDDFVYEDTSMKHRVGLHMFSESDVIKKLQQLLTHSNIIWFSNDEIRQELYRLLGTAEARNTLLMNDLDAHETDPQFGAKLSERHISMLSGIPLLGIITTNFDDPTAFVQAGQTLERVALEAKLRGMGVHPLPQLVELPEMRSSLEDILPDNSGFPQLPFAMGYVDYPQRVRSPSQ